MEQQRQPTPGVPSPWGCSINSVQIRQMPTGQELPCVRLPRLPHRNGMFLNSWKIFSRGRQNIMSGKWINLPTRLKPSRPNWLKRGAAVKKKSDVRKKNAGKRKKRRKMRMPPLYVKCSPASNHWKKHSQKNEKLQSRL